MSSMFVIAKGPGGFGHEREVGVAVEGKQEGYLWLWKYSLSRLYQGQHPDCDTAP